MATLNPYLTFPALRVRRWSSTAPPSAASCRSRPSPRWATRATRGHALPPRHTDRAVPHGERHGPGTEGTPAVGDAITLSISGGPDDDLRGCFERLAEGGQVTMPLERQMWGDDFGMLADRYGMPWMVNIAGEQS
ncbi:VOC family protein [Janibacter melonis]|uniref:VOC family protein n=1 Tax=Janibacter melonis TaxID=262209 RepID=UPI003555E12A